MLAFHFYYIDKSGQEIPEKKNIYIYILFTFFIKETKLHGFGFMGEISFQECIFSNIKSQDLASRKTKNGVNHSSSSLGRAKVSNKRL